MHTNKAYNTRLDRHRAFNIKVGPIPSLQQKQDRSLGPVILLDFPFGPTVLTRPPGYLGLQHKEGPPQPNHNMLTYAHKHITNYDMKSYIYMKLINPYNIATSYT